MNSVLEIDRGVAWFMRKLTPISTIALVHLAWLHCVCSLNEWCFAVVVHWEYGAARLAGHDDRRDEAMTFHPAAGVSLRTVHLLWTLTHFKAMTPLGAQWCMKRLLPDMFFEGVWHCKHAEFPFILL
jgi:hypothetical protein